MSSAVEKPKLLIVDTAPAMAQVLKTYAEHNSYEPDVFSDSQEACGALAQRFINPGACLLYTSPSPRDRTRSRMPSSA